MVFEIWLKIALKRHPILTFGSLQDSLLVAMKNTKEAKKSLA